MNSRLQELAALVGVNTSGLPLASASVRASAQKTASSEGSDAPGPPPPAVGPDSWTGPLRQETPLPLQLADLLVEPGDEGGVAFGLLILTVAEDAGGALHKGFLPSLNLPGVDFVPGGQLGHRLLPFTASRATFGIRRSESGIPGPLGVSGHRRT